MLPNILSENLCSLLKDTTSYTFTLNVKIINNNISNIWFNNCKINVTENFVYEHPKLLKSGHYKLLYNTLSSLQSHTKLMDNITDSHDIIQYMMIFMNVKCAEILHENAVGIFRSDDITHSNTIINTDMKREILQIYDNTRSKYTVLTSSDINVKHSSLNLDMYVHITSPIRRIVDLLNITSIQLILNLAIFKDGAVNFINHWNLQINNINNITRTINKLQNDFDNLNYCLINKNILQQVYDCFIIDIINTSHTNNMLKNVNKYSVFIQKIKMFVYLETIEDLTLYQKYKCKIYLFNNERTMKQKIKIQIV
jgi:exoribonuclease R